MATSHMTTYELETLFIEKLTEKYNLTERSIKKAFSRFDTDGNGLLNLNELVAGFEMFLNGVSHKQVEALVFSYDMNGDGVISFEEFFQFLTNRQQGKQRTDTNPNKQKRVDRVGGHSSRLEGRTPPQRQRPPLDGRTRAQPQRQQQQKQQQKKKQQVASARHQDGYDDYECDPSEQSIPDDVSSMRDEYLDQQDQDQEQEQEQDSVSSSLYSYSQTDDTRSELSSVFDPALGTAVESRVKIFTESLKAYLYQEAMKMRRDEKIANSHQITFRHLSETVSRSLLERAFQREANRSGGRGDELMNLKSFCK
jgi:hypothetical protein